MLNFLKEKLKKNINSFLADASLIFDNDEETMKQIDEDITNFLNTTKRSIEDNFIYKNELEQIKQCEKNISKYWNFEEIFELLKELNLKTALPINLEYWQKRIENFENLTTDEQIIFKKLLIEELYKNLNFLIYDWQMQELEKIKKEFDKIFVKLLKKLKKIQKNFESMGLYYGNLWSLLKTEISNGNDNILLKWLDFFKNNKTVLELCDLLGREIGFNKNKSVKKILDTNTYKISVPKIDSKEEISGVKLGKELEFILPNELSLLNDSDLEILFDLKYIEEKLMNFDLLGYEDIEKIVEEEKEAEEEQKGPVILCVDTSGSMFGDPENIAKAISFYISSKAISEKRKCLIINFSANIEVIELDEKSSISKLINFLKKSFHGGTDIYPALEYSLKKVKEENFQKSDILILSDFVLSIDDKKTTQKINEAKLLENKFYSICISQSYFPPNNMDNIFTKQWIYDSKTSKINLLNI